jgi:hypothetical protein
MNIFHKSFFDQVHRYTIDELRHSTMKEVCTFFPWIILTMGFISYDMRQQLRDDFQCGLAEGLKSLFCLTLLFLGPLLIFPISIPILLLVHWIISRKYRRSRMIDALKGKFHGR